MDLLLTHGYFLSEDTREQKVMKPYPPLGILYISSYLKARGFDIAIFDSTFHTSRDFVTNIEKRRPPLVGISANLATRPNVLRMIEQCKRLGSKVIVGGPDIPHHADLYLRRGADAAASGEAEITLEELLPILLAGSMESRLDGVKGLIYRDEAGHVVRTPPRPPIPDLDAMPPPDREAVDIESYLRCWRERHGTASLSVVTARGCPYSCQWCSRSVFGLTHRRRSPASVVAEIRHIVDRYHPDMLWYVDDVFTINRDWILRFDAEMAAGGLRVPFECISRPDRIDEQVADSLVRLGCFRLWMGVESGSQRILDAMSRRITVEQARQATGLLRSRGIQVGVFIMLGYPGEEESDLNATVDYLRMTSPDTFLTTVAYPIKGTPFYDAVQDRIVESDEAKIRTDRDLRIKGRRTPVYYAFAQRWLAAEVARDRVSREGHCFRAARVAMRSWTSHLGMRLTDHLRER